MKRSWVPLNPIVKLRCIEYCSLLAPVLPGFDTHTADGATIVIMK